MTLKEDVDAFIAQRIRAYLAEHGGNVTHAAKAAGISRQHWYKVAKKVRVATPQARRGNAAWRALADK